MTYEFPYSEGVSDIQGFVEYFTGIGRDSSKLILQNINHSIEKVLDNSSVESILRYGITFNKMPYGYTEFIDLLKENNQVIQAAYNAVAYSNEELKRKGISDDIIRPHIIKRIEEIPANANFKNTLHPKVFDEWTHLKEILTVVGCPRSLPDMISSPATSLLASQTIIIPSEFDDSDPLSDTSSSITYTSLSSSSSTSEQVLDIGDLRSVDIESSYEENDGDEEEEEDIHVPHKKKIRRYYHNPSSSSSSSRRQQQQVEYDIPVSLVNTSDEEND